MKPKVIILNTCVKKKDVTYRQVALCLTNGHVLDQLLDVNALSKKGYRSQTERERAAAVEFTTARRRHPAVESAIQHLERRELDRVRSHGHDGFTRTVALAVLAANGHHLGRLIRQTEYPPPSRSVILGRPAGISGDRRGMLRGRPEGRMRRLGN